MTIPTWVLLGFAGWTILLLSIGVGVYRWTVILSGRAAPKDLRHDALEGHHDFYKRAMRAHGNCVENLPVYGAIVVAMMASGVHPPEFDVLALVLAGARVIHSTIHLSFRQTNPVVVTRFSFFVVQLVCMAWMGVAIAVAAA